MVTLILGRHECPENNFLLMCIFRDLSFSSHVHYLMLIKHLDNYNAYFFNRQWIEDIYAHRVLYFVDWTGGRGRHVINIIRMLLDFTNLLRYISYSLSSLI